uniref:Uncharacterized protein n=2 Tax=Eutreptiella gymnastica TaxID=73025 RepID=A0A6T2EXN1_9EUGL
MGPGFMYDSSAEKMDKLRHDHLHNSANSAFDSKLDRFKPGKTTGPGMIYNAFKKDTIQHNIDSHPISGYQSAFKGGERFNNKPQGCGADRVYSYKCPTDIQTRVGQYMAK